MADALALCNACKAPSNLTVHHIVPRSLGGHDGPDNYAILCQYCHNAVHWVKPLDTLPRALERMQDGSRKYHRTRRMVERTTNPEVREVLNRLRLVIQRAEKREHKAVEYIRSVFNELLFYEWLQQWRQQECPTVFNVQSSITVM